MKSYERPNVPTGELGKVFDLAEKFRAIDQAPAVSVTHFLLAFIFSERPDRARDILKLAEIVKGKWESEIDG